MSYSSDISPDDEKVKAKMGVKCSFSQPKTEILHTLKDLLDYSMVGIIMQELFEFSPLNFAAASTFGGMW